ncbi:replication initiation protein [Rhodoferax antarcticus]|uniref:replication initiation protein n=1 Tax=Rhodoferax antarcticus TaxID=81479 RepID=UPI00222463AE|nr:replication initiation protein [Rhodoferax antarcticus]MCW2314063.1 hypothetical protein [Rhodoferax antarcticus]
MSKLSPPTKVFPLVLKKHVAAVHTSGVLSLVERKIANILLLNAYDDLVQEDGREVRHRIPVGYLGNMVGWDDSNNVSSLKAAMVSLQKTTVEFNLMKDGKESWESMSMLSYASVRNGVCTYGYVSELARKLSDPDVFATINVGVQKRFRSGYSLTLYENCVRYRNVQSTGWWELHTFRRIMGADAEMYNDFKRLSSFVITKSVAEVNLVSDIKIAVEYQRRGRKVVALRFIVTENRQQPLFGPAAFNDDELDVIRASETFKRLRAHGVGERLALAAIKQDPEQARLAIDTAEARDQAGGIKTTTGAYITKLIEVKAVLGQTEYAKQKELTLKKKKSKATYDSLLTNFQHMAVTAAVKALPSDRLAAFALKFFETLPDDKQLKVGRFDPRSGKFASATINAEFKPWLNKAVAPEFNHKAFAAYVREQGHDPVELGAYS